MTQQQRTRLMKRGRLLTSKIRLESWESWIVPNAGDTYTCKATDRFGIPVDVHTVDAAKMFVRDWKVRVLIKCKAPDGAGYIEEREIIAEGIRLQELTDFFKTQREDALRSVNKHHIQDIGWVAVALN